MTTDSTLKVLSIDPSQAPAGVVNAEMTLRFMRRHGIARSVVSNRNARIAKSLFCASAPKSASKVNLIVRLAFGTALVGVGVYCFSVASVLLAIAAIVAGMMVVTGTVNRALGIVGSAASLLMLFAAHSAAEVIPCAIAMGGFAYLAISGPGRFSVDFFLQRALRKRLGRSTSAACGLDDYRAFARL